MLTTLEKLRAYREGASVQRCHTTRHQGSYDVAQHSYGVAMIIVCLNPTASADLITAALLHDIPERWMGDLPATVYDYDPDLAVSLLCMEEKLDKILGTGVELTAEEQLWLVSADVLELWLWATEHVHDSPGVALIQRGTLRRLLTMSLPPAIVEVVSHISNHPYRLDLIAEKIEKGLKST